MMSTVQATDLVKAASTPPGAAAGGIPYNPNQPWMFGSPPGVTGGPTTTPVPVPTSGTTGVTAAKTHQAIVAILIMGAFVYLMTLLAGTSQAAGRIIGALFVGLLLIQGAAHVNPFVEWVNKHPLTPTP